MKRIEALNDFVVKFANVNGSGSASAHELFAKAILRMGVPVSPRNIFPSNIQGLPTWYEVRVSEQGWLGRRGGIDMMVAMKPQTWDVDVKGSDSGGDPLYASNQPQHARRHRHDGGDEPADRGRRRQGDRLRGLPVLRQHQAAARERFSQRHQRDRHA